MFEDSLFATNKRPSAQRGAAAVASFCVQAVFLGLLVLVPLLYTDALPLGTLKSYVEIPLPPSVPAQPPPQTQAHRPPPQHESEIRGAILLQPNRIPDRIAHIEESAAPPPPGAYVPNSIGGGNGASSQLFRDILASNMRPAPPRPTERPAKPLVISTGVSEGLVIQRLTPIYPAIARQAGIQGPVVMHAIIGRDGTIQNLQLISGHPMLVRAAMDAVQHWRYRPYLLNNEPVDVETQITVNFTLGR